MFNSSSLTFLSFDSNTGKEYLNFYVSNPVAKFFFGDFSLSQRQLDEIELEKDEEEDEEDQVICFTENGEVYGYIYGEKNYIPTEREFESNNIIFPVLIPTKTSTVFSPMKSLNSIVVQYPFSFFDHFFSLPL